jgi:hypothetical protein
LHPSQIAEGAQRGPVKRVRRGPVDGTRQGDCCADANALCPLPLREPKAIQFPLVFYFTRDAKIGP